MNAPSAGLMDFAPLWSTPATSITTVNASTLVAPSIIPSVATTKQHILGGIVNPEAYCDLCQRSFAAVFPQETKARMHDIVPPDESGTIDRDLPAVASSSGSSHKSTSLRSPPCSRRSLLFDGGTTSCSSSSSSSPADSGNNSYSRRSDSARWASSTRKNFLRFATNNTTEIIRQHYDNKKNNSSDSPGPKAERWTEQKMSLNLATSPRASDQQQTADDGMPLLYEFCQRPFQPVYTCCTCTAPDFTTNHLLLDRMIPGQQPRTTIRRPDQWQRSWRYRQGGGRSNANLHSPVIDHLLPVRQQRYPQALFLQTHMQNTCCGRC